MIAWFSRCPVIILKSYPLTVPILLLALGVHSLAEAADATELSFEFPKFADNRAEITVDGKLDEAVWSEVPAFDNMVVIDPDTMKPAQFTPRVGSSTRTRVST